MAHDGQDPKVDTTAKPQVLLPDLVTLTGAAVAPAEAILDIARDKLKVLVSENGRVSSRLVELHQTASHGFAWLATYVQALRQMQAWAEKLVADDTSHFSRPLPLKLFARRNIALNVVALETSHLPRSASMFASV